jgi:hypothetical protein
MAEATPKPGLQACVPMYAQDRLGGVLREEGGLLMMATSASAPSEQSCQNAVGGRRSADPCKRRCVVRDSRFWLDRGGGEELIKLS